MPHETAESAATPTRLAVLISGGGTTLTNLQARIDAGSLDAEVVLVVASNDHAAQVIQNKHADAPLVIVRRKDHESTAAFSEAIWQHIRGAGAQIVCLAGFLSLLSIPDDYQHKVLNIHPSLLPSFGGEGMYGQRVHEAVLAHGCKVSGCTVHLADDTYDTGPILVQKAVPVEDGDTPETLAARVFEAECEAYPEAIRMVAEGRV